MSSPSSNASSDLPADRSIALASARDLLRRGEAGEAVQRYREILTTHPSDVEGRRGLAEALAAHGEYRSALQEFDTIVTETPGDLSAWRGRASTARSLADPVELLRSLEAIVSIDPADRSTRLEEYHLRDLTGDRAGAFRALSALTDGTETPGDGPSLAELLLCQGDLAIQLGDGSGAEAAYERAARADESMTAAVAIRRARLAIADGRPDLALERLQPAFGNGAGTEGPTEALEVRAELLLSVERPGEAQTVYDALLARDPTSGTALVGAARSRIDQGHHPEARELLHRGRDRVGRDERLTLALAEAESGSGDLSAAEREVRDGVEAFPESRAMWTRLAELAVVRSDWTTARDAYARAEALDRRGLDAVLGTAFVAEKLEDTEAALAAYDRAVEIGPGDLRVWNRRGAFLLSVHRSAEAVTSFDRALALAPESDIARDGKRLAERERRTSTVDEIALNALRTEYQLGRPITKNDLFVNLHVPFDLLDPVLAAIAREVKIDIGALAPADLECLEGRSCDLITTALRTDGRVRDSGELSLPDVAALAPPTASLSDVQRLFAYVDAVLRLDVRPENLHLTAEVEETARRALSLPVEQRTLFGLVRTLQIGLYRAQIVKAVERASGASRTPLPSVDLSAHGPELVADPATADAARFFDPENEARRPELQPLSGSPSSAPRRVPRGWPGGVPLLGTQREAVRSQSSDRCVGCGGLATLRHPCGGPLCRLCASQFGNCPKCGAAIGPLGPGARPRPRAEAPKSSSTRAPVVPAKLPTNSVAVRHPSGPPRVAKSPAPQPATSPGVTQPKAARPAGTTAVPAPDAPTAPPPRPRREKTDDEPRL
ncbi:MAG: tetratricopeptide repeat protein [Thermoplasmata archaeon]